MGVTKVGNRFRARYTVNGKRYNVGVFDTKIQAERALENHKMAGDTPFLAIPQKDFDEPFFIPTPTLKERVVKLWRSLVKSLRERNLI